MSKKTTEPTTIDYTKYHRYTDREYNMLVLLGLALDDLLKVKGRHVEKYGLTATEFHLLLVVDQLGDRATPAELSRVLVRKPSSTTTLLNRMTKKGLVRRISHPHNVGNIKKVVMTKKGQEAFELARQDDVTLKIMQAIPKKDFDQLWLLLEELREITVQHSEPITEL